ncbi:ABC transporter substrate-binding protein [Alteromonas sp. ASW11-36]|uniref:ABC transporter substrate-binding protein n=1 Tax=Alteromonas arenosi TaxID=3055817 RepID=A0ABT7T1L6_9ALTE|nr:ABC transporter substrate-binding protein [Alteromonas sp. ASW11-36]MDM7862306.1 ABC transporter substrate-binding protein [Alteromonas sp. ASW11-36]
MEFYHILAARFENQYPQTKIRIKSQTMESHKRRVEAFYHGDTQEIDVMLAFAGTQLNTLIASGHIASLEALWNENDFDVVFSDSTKQIISDQGEPFALPVGYYQWGFYYRKSLFEQWNLSVPQTWQELLEFTKDAKEFADAPLNFSGASQWTTLAWFDYIALRLMGREHYLALLNGQRSFLSPEVESIFSHWQELIEAGGFDNTQVSLTWQEALPFFYRGKTAITLQGNFFLADAPEGILDDIGFFPFPNINPRMPRYEIAPTDVAVMSKSAVNKPFVREFIEFLSAYETQAFFSDYVDIISPRNDYLSPNNRLLQVGAEHLKSSDGIVQFFDRETTVEFTQEAAQLFVEFMQGKLDIDTVVSELEGAREKYLLPKVLQ